jgi:hypothetical protein
VGDRVRNHIPTVQIGFVYNPKDTRLPFYLNEFVQTLPNREDVEFVCFSLSDIKFDSMTVFCTIVNGKGIFEQKANLPKLIFNFGYHTKLENIKAMRQLRTAAGYKVINPINRFNQAVIYDIVRSFPQSDQFLLPFCSLSKEKTMQQLEKSNVLYLLPERGLSAENFIRAEKAPDQLVKISAGAKELFCSQNELYDNLLKMTTGKRYISMEGITLLQRNGLPLEARIYMQKNEKNQWKPAFSAAKSDILSYDSTYQDTRDDLSSALFEAAPKTADEISENICNLSVTLSSYLDYYVIDMASATLDFVIGNDGHPYLLMYSGCEQRFRASNESAERIYYYNIFRYMLHAYGENPGAGNGEL